MSSFVHSGQGPDGVLSGGHAVLLGRQAPQGGRQHRRVARAGQHHAGTQGAQSGSGGSPHGGSPLVGGDRHAAAPQRAPCPLNQNQPAPRPCAHGFLSPVETRCSPGPVAPGTARTSADLLNCASRPHRRGHSARPGAGRSGRGHPARTGAGFPSPYAQTAPTGIESLSPR